MQFEIDCPLVVWLHQSDVNCLHNHILQPITLHCQGFSIEEQNGHTRGRQTPAVWQRGHTDIQGAYRSQTDPSIQGADRPSIQGADRSQHTRGRQIPAYRGQTDPNSMHDREDIQGKLTPSLWLDQGPRHWETWKWFCNQRFMQSEHWHPNNYKVQPWLQGHQIRGFSKTC